MLAQELSDGHLLVAHYDRLDDLNKTELEVVQSIARLLGERLATAKPLTFLAESEDDPKGSSSDHTPLDLYSDTDTTPPLTSALTGKKIKTPLAYVDQTLAKMDRRRDLTGEVRTKKLRLSCYVCGHSALVEIDQVQNGLDHLGNPWWVNLAPTGHRVPRNLCPKHKPKGTSYGQQ